MSGAALDGIRRRRRGVVLATVLVGLAACAVAGGPTLPMAGLAAGGIAAGRLRGDGTPGPAVLRRWRFANLLALAASGGGVVLGLAPLPVVGVAFVGWLLVHRAWTGRTPADARVSLLLSLLLVLLACILTVSPWLAPLFLVAAVLTPIALVLVHLEDAAAARGAVARRQDAGLGGLWLLAPASIVLTGLFFLGIPRMEGAGVGGNGAGADMAGFGQDIELGDLGAILDNPDVVLRARIRDASGAPLTGPFYFRGIALDQFDGRRWKETIGGEVRLGSQPWAPVEQAELIRQDIVLEPMGEAVLFGLPRVHRLEGVGDATVDTSGTWRWRGAPERLEYTVWSVPQVVGGPPPARGGLVQVARRRNERAALRAGVWTSTPPGLDPRIPALAEELTRGLDADATDLDVALALQRHLREAYTYTDVPEVEDARQPLSDFLFRSRRGHCEFFATALAILLRSRGVPARVVNGFYGGEYNDFGEFVLVRQSDAHSWVEAWVDDQGWVQLDATPAADAPARPSVLVRAGQWGVDAWHRVVLDYDLDSQLDGLAAVASAVPRLKLPGPSAPVVVPGGRGIVVLLGIVAVIAAGRRLAAWLAGARLPRQGRRKTPLQRLHARARALVRRRGWDVPPGLPPVEAAEWLVVRAGKSAEPLRELAWRLYRVRYGGEAEGAHLAAARGALRALEALPKRRRDWGAAPSSRPGG